MARHLLSALLLPLAALVAACSAPARSDAASITCSAMSGAIDAATALESCLGKAPDGAEIRLPAGRHELRHPIRITKAVTLRSAGVAANGPRCPIDRDGACATLVLAVAAPFAEANQMPIEIKAAHVGLSHVRIVGAAARDQARCRSDRDRPAGGGLRVWASDFTLAGSVIRDVTCYTAMEVAAGADRLTVRDSFIGYNGDHSPGGIWADGLTIHDAQGVRVTGNSFVDNTDVQLILGGCRGCTVTGNIFRHSGRFTGSSFAELMIHSWPTTSGDFTGSLFKGNDIDCGAARRCGYGIMVGSSPWYVGRAFGGSVQANRVSRAMIGLNADTLTGPMEIADNRVAGSGGVFPSACGPRRWAGVNIVAQSRPLARGLRVDGAGSDGTTGCMLNLNPA